MPTLLPPGGDVDWPLDEGVLGVVGVAPWATTDFLAALYSRIPATKDWHYPRVLVDLNPKLPSRGRHLELGETDPSPFIARTIAELADAGATVVVVPCNTAHILYERWAHGAPVPVLHIVDATVESMRRRGATRVAVLTSRSLRRDGLFARRLERAGLAHVPLDESLAESTVRAIDEVKRSGRIAASTLDAIRTGLEALRADAVVGLALGCTELSSLGPLAEPLGFAVAESNASLAEAAIGCIATSPPAHRTSP